MYPLLLLLLLLLLFIIIIIIIISISSSSSRMQVYKSNHLLWSFTEVWMRASLHKFPKHFSVFWLFLIML